MRFSIVVRALSIATFAFGSTALAQDALPPPDPEPAPIPASEPASASAPASTPAPESTAPVIVPSDGVDHRQSMWRFELGYKGSWIASAGLDPFSKNDHVPQVSLAASRTIFTSGRFSFAPGIAWDHASVEGLARGDQATLSLDHLSVPLEGRMHFREWGYAFLRAAPGAMHESATVNDASSPGPLAKDRWVFAGDVSVGFAALIFPRTDAISRVHTWLQADAGYGWAASQRLALRPDLAGDDPTRTGGVDLGSLAMRGPFLRVAAAISF